MSQCMHAIIHMRKSNYHQQKILSQASGISSERQHQRHQLSQVSLFFRLSSSGIGSGSKSGIWCAVIVGATVIRGDPVALTKKENEKKN